ncbi:MAG: phosphatidate cytidylyltransferase [Betaproteobacteria bacterium]
MLRQRIITAVVLLLVLLPAMFYPSATPLTALAIGFIAAAAWEWARLVGYGRAMSIGSAATCALACGLAWAGGLVHQPMVWLWSLMACVWVIGGAWLLHGGMALWSRIPRAFRLAFGFLILMAAWLALAQARHVGVNFVLSIMALVWAADISAYVAGRTWGGRIVAGKLAPTISPGKTWEGVAGAVVGVLLLALLWQWADGYFQSTAPSLYSRLLQSEHWIMLPALVGLVGISVVGDLIESLLKRTAGVKDSSGLLPGHGGVLDRIDALLPVMPLALLLVSL